MSSFAFIACSCFLMAAPPETPKAKEKENARKQRPGRTTDVFSRLDRDSDGKVALEDLPQRARTLFGRADTNSDGTLTRKEFEEARQRFRQGATGMRRLAEEIDLKQDLPYAGTENPRQRLDLLLPKTPKSDKPLPVVVFIHGGGWQNGDKRSGVARVAPIVATGSYAGASVGYRLTDEASWPSQIHDCKAAIRWIKANAEKYHLDPERIGVIGTSAGGHLVAMLGTGGDVSALEGELGGHTGQDSRVACVVDMYGPADLLTMSQGSGAFDHDAPNSPESKLVGGPLQETKEVARDASPTTHVSSSDVPFLIIHGSEDKLVPYHQSEKLHKKLKEAGVSSTLIKVRGGGHGGFRSPEVNKRIGQFFDKQLRGEEVEISDEPIVEAPREQRRQGRARQKAKAKS
ncbi:Carboxylesterase NlhH [Planctomycetes bacterium Pan216]|uniref:Carboxylesterase NlhH n=1 Tax=Kolteria novifilia TaxID=2527975 RepID=A0A518B540_9BACT|nr:Carboxylesterase NlhH [Planctomycetes bacterium Pan216]